MWGTRGWWGRVLVPCGVGYWVGVWCGVQGECGMGYRGAVVWGTGGAVVWGTGGVWCGVQGGGRVVYWSLVGPLVGLL